MRVLDNPDLSVFAPWLVKWRLQADGAPFASQWSRLLPVRRDGNALMLKAAMAEQEVKGSAFLQWLGGRGAVRVFEREADAVLMERATGERSLFEMASSGDDGAALKVLTDVARTLHERPLPPDDLIALDQWLAGLRQAALERGGLFVEAAELADRLQATAEPARPLHGDLHHGNVLDGGERGWLAIDPKGLLGDRGFDFASVLCCPGLTALAPGRIQRQTAIIAEETGLAPIYLLQWLLAFAGLAAAGCIRDGFDPGPALAIAEIAAGEL
jgi:streptomycin 6-kinase